VSLNSINKNDLIADLLQSRDKFQTSCGEEESAGSDSDPSGDNLDDEEIAKWIPKKSKV
jgi:hypothetical protein